MNIEARSTADNLSTVELAADPNGSLLSNPGKLDAVNDEVANGGTAAQVGGLLGNHFVSAATTNATSVKASAGRIYGVLANNINAAARYLKLYNKATAPAPATDTPVLVVALPPASNQAIMIPAGLACSLGIGLALVTGIADNDNAAVAAAEHTVTVLYK